MCIYIHTYISIYIYIHIHILDKTITVKHAVQNDHRAYECIFT